MKKIHQHLIEKHPWYAKWHQNSYHPGIHWAVFLFFTLILSSSVLSAIAQTTDSVSPSQVSNTHLLTDGEYAVIINPGDDNAKTVQQTISIYGENVTLDVPENTTIKTILYQPGVDTYVSLDTPGLMLLSSSDATGYDPTGKIDTAIYRMLKKQNKVSVIVNLKLSSDFYNSDDSEAARSSKSKDFSNAKASVADSIGNDGKIEDDLKIINGLSLEVDSAALEKLKSNPMIDTVDLDREIAADLDVSVPQINAPYVWAQNATNGIPLTGVGIRIAIIDSGVDYTHPDLGGCFGSSCKVVDGYDFVNNDNDPMDDYGHGTHVAAIAAGKGFLKGVAPDAKIVAYKVLNSKGKGVTSKIVKAIDRSTDPNGDGNTSDHVDVANISISHHCLFYSPLCGPFDNMSRAVEKSTLLGVTYTIAAGNDGPKKIGSPGTAASAITVAASCKNSQIGTESHCNTPVASFSSRGSVYLFGLDLKKPDIAAPGVLICAARLGNVFPTAPACLPIFSAHHVILSGTSMAAPHLAGAVALIKQANPNFRPYQIKGVLKASARKLFYSNGVVLPYNIQGAGEVDLKAAILLAPPSSPPIYQCNDKIDNDRDGLIDYPADPGCTSETDNDEHNPLIVTKYQCKDLRDNDGDGLIDYPNDPGCTSATDNDESN